METTKRRYRTTRHAERLARRSLADAGSRRRVAQALGRSESTISHEVTDRSHPTIRAAFELLLSLDGEPGVNAVAFAEAAAEVVELSEVVNAASETLIERGIHLLGQENELGFREDMAALTGDGHAEALRRVARASAALARIIDELELRDIDLHALYRAREVAA